MAIKKKTEAAVAAPKKDSLEDRVAALEAQLKEVAYTVRKHFGRGKTLPLLALCLFIPAASIAADAVQKYKGDGTTSWTYDKDGDVTVAGGDVILTAGSVVSTPAATALVAGSAITVSAATMNLSAAAQGNATVTNTIVAPAVAGTWAVLINVGASNSVELTEGATLDSGGTKTLGPEDVLLLFAPDTTAWKAIYHDN